MDSTLTLRKSDYEQKLGVFFGWGRGAAGGEKAWSDRQAAKIRDCVESGLRRFYVPTVQGGQSYNWSFLRPVRVITLRSGQSSVELPEDCGGVEGHITVSSEAAGNYCRIEFYNPGRIDEMYAMTPDSAGRPLCASTRSKKMQSGSGSQRQEVYVFPRADADYFLKFEYYIMPNYLDGSADQAYGGPEHVETILTSCLAVAEERYDNVPNGPQSQAFARQLQASIAIDRRKKPQVLGINSDHSDDGFMGRSTRYYDRAPGVLINGVDTST